jgi:hypothetical protein
LFFLDGAVISWKTLIQATYAFSKAELEFLAASDIGRLGLYIRAVLDKLLQNQHAATTVYEDNNAFQIVAHSTSPIRQMRHINIHDFALQDWTERNSIALTACVSNANSSDMFTNNDHISGSATFFRINPDLLLVPIHLYGSREG